MNRGVIHGNRVWQKVVSQPQYLFSPSPFSDCARVPLWATEDLRRLTDLSFQLRRRPWWAGSRPSPTAATSGPGHAYSPPTRRLPHPTPTSPCLQTQKNKRGSTPGGSGGRLPAFPPRALVRGGNLPTSRAFPQIGQLRTCPLALSLPPSCLSPLVSNS